MLTIVRLSDVVAAIGALMNVDPKSHGQGGYTIYWAAASAHSPFDKLRVSGSRRYERVEEM